MRKNSIRHVNDFILAIAMIAFSLFLLFCPGITTAIPILAQGGFFTRADTYIRMLAVILLISAAALLVRSLTASPTDGKGKFYFLLDNTISLTVAALIAYTLLLPKIGFFITSFVMIVLLNLLYCFREKSRKRKEYSRRELCSMLLSAAVYALILMLILWLVFAKLLGVRLP